MTCSFCEDIYATESFLEIKCIKCGEIFTLEEKENLLTKTIKGYRIGDVFIISSMNQKDMYMYEVTRVNSEGVFGKIIT